MSTSAEFILSVKLIQKTLREDPELWDSWQSNIAHITADSLRSEFFELTQAEASYLSNRFADRLMNHFFEAPRDERYKR